MKVRDVGLQLLDGPGDRIQSSTATCGGEHEAERREALKRLVVQLACPPDALRLGCGQSLASVLVGRRLRGRDGRGSTGRKRLQQPLVIGGEPAAIESIDRHQGAVRPTAKEQRDDQPIVRLKADLTEPKSLKAGVVELSASGRPVRRVRWRSCPRG
jgi:hypothetical protein